jgi:hypothetical protein
MTVSTRLLAGVVAVSALAIALTACTSSDTATPATSTPSASSTAVADDSGLSFAQGNDLAADVDTAPAFINGFADTDSGWAEADGTDASQGRWNYTSSDGLCSASLSQVVADDDSFEFVEGDDRTSSINVLSWFYRDNADLAAQIADAATDATLPYGTDWEVGDAGTDFMGVSAQAPEGGAFATYARAFGVPQVALVVELTCDTADAFAAHAQDALLDSSVIGR